MCRGGCDSWLRPGQTNNLATGLEPLGLLCRIAELHTQPARLLRHCGHLLEFCMCRVGIGTAPFCRSVRQIARSVLALSSCQHDKQPNGFAVRLAKAWWSGHLPGTDERKSVRRHTVESALRCYKACWCEIAVICRTSKESFPC